MDQDQTQVDGVSGDGLPDPATVSHETTVPVDVTERFEPMDEAGVKLYMAGLEGLDKSELATVALLNAQSMLTEKGRAKHLEHELEAYSTAPKPDWNKVAETINKVDLSGTLSKDYHAGWINAAYLNTAIQDIGVVRPVVNFLIGKREGVEGDSLDRLNQLIDVVTQGGALVPAFNEVPVEDEKKSADK